MAANITDSSDEDELWSNEAAPYELEVEPHLAPKLVRLLRLVRNAESGAEAVWLDFESRKDVARLEGSFESQLRDQGYDGDL